MKQLLFALTCISPLVAMELVVKDEGLFVPNKLGSLEVMRTNEGYEVIQDKIRHPVHSYDVDPLLNNLDKAKLALFLASGAGYIEVSQLDDLDFKLKSRVRGNGGGPICGTLAYWGTKALCYGTAAAGAGAAVAATGGGAAGAFVGLGSVGALTGGAAGGAGLVAGTIAGAGCAEGAALVTASVITASSSGAGAIALVETASTGMGVLFTAIPFLP